MSDAYPPTAPEDVPPVPPMHSQTTYAPEERRPSSYPPEPRTAPPRRGGGCIISALSALFGALVGAGLVAALLLALYGAPGRTTTTTKSSGGSNQNVTINTSDTITFAEAVAKKVLPSVVMVGIEQTVRDPFTGQSSTQTVGNGSGVIIRADGYILTNDHVVADATKLTVQLGVEQLPATVVGRDSSSDLAVIKVDRTNLHAIEMGSSGKLQVGEPVVAIGSPFGLSQTVTTGIVSALGRSSLAENAGATVTAYTSLIQTDAAINPGNSGGALCDSSGKLIGINTLIQTGASGVDQSAGVGFAIPVDFAKQIAEELISTGKAVHPFLGVSMVTVDPNVAQQFNLPVTSGALVQSVSPGSPAEKAGIQNGDIIVKIGDKDITSVEDVFAAIRSHKVGDKVSVDIIRGTKKQTLEATLGSDASSQ